MSENPQKADSLTDGPGSLSNFAVLWERVGNFDRRLGELAGSLEKTNAALLKATDSMAALGKPKWALWISAGTLIAFVTAGAWGLAISMAISPIDERVADLKVVEVATDTQERLDIQRVESDLKSKADNAVIDKLIDKLEIRIDQLNRNLGFGKK